MHYVHLLKSKIHRATITHADLNYIGSLTIDENLMDAAGLREFELVHVADLTNGARLGTYVMKGERGSGIMCINGAAAHLVNVGDLIIVFAYALVSEEEADEFKPKLVFVDKNNRQVTKEEAT